jgi:cytosine/creatinine deaminase
MIRALHFSFTEAGSSADAARYGRLSPDWRARVLIIPPPSPEVVRSRSVAHPLLLRGPRLPDGRIEDVAIAGGVIVSVGGDPAGRPPPQVLDLRGYLLLPSLVEPHAHLPLAGPVTGAGELSGHAAGLDRWAAAAPGLVPADIATLAWSKAARYLAAGTTAIRVHVDVGKESGLQAVGALLEVRAGLAGILDIQIVAAVSGPLTGLAGAARCALLRQALAAGADLAGSGPGLGDGTGRAVEALAVTAASAGVGIDLHIGAAAGLEPGSLGRLAAIARAGFGYPLTVSHLASLGAKRKEQRRMTRSLADAGIGVVVVPRSAPFRPGADLGSAAPADPRGPSVVRELLAAGVPVAAGGGPHAASGRAEYTDPLGTASELVAGRLTPAEAIIAIGAGGRRIMRLPDVEVVPGSPADLVAIRAPDLWDAVASRAADRIVLRGGQVVARNIAVADLSRQERAVAMSAWN